MRVKPGVGQQVGIGKEESQHSATPPPDIVSGRIMTGSLGYYVRVEGSGPPVLLLHGFTGSHRSWDALAASLRPSYTVVRPDLPGHAASVVAKGQSWSIDTVVFSLFRLMRELGFPAFSCVGYSMGGRVALSMAAKAPARLHALVVESGSPGLEDALDRERRKTEDEELAEQMESLGLIAFVNSWANKPLFGTQSRVPDAGRREQQNIRLSHLVSGLAASLRQMGTGVQPSVWEFLPKVNVPSLLITGEEDAKFNSIAKRMESMMPDARHLAVSEAGHAVHLEQPEVYRLALAEFLGEHARGGLESGWSRGAMFADEEEQ